MLVSVWFDFLGWLVLIGICGFDVKFYGVLLDLLFFMVVLLDCWLLLGMFVELFVGVGVDVFWVLVILIWCCLCWVR